MSIRTIEYLNDFREDLRNLIDDYLEVLYESTNNVDLHDAIQINVIDKATETLENADTLIEEIENGNYKEDKEEIEEW